jgi:hypothetical protein
MNNNDFKDEHTLRKEIKKLLETILQDKDNMLVEKKGKRKSTGPDGIAPPITDLTKLWIEDPTQYRSKVRTAITKAGGHLPIAADNLGISLRTLQRHINSNFAPGELDNIKASPGPDKEWDVEAGKKKEKSRKKKQKGKRWNDHFKKEKKFKDYRPERGHGKGG